MLLYTLFITLLLCHFLTVVYRCDVLLAMEARTSVYSEQNQCESDKGCQVIDINLNLSLNRDSYDPLHHWIVTEWCTWDVQTTRC